MNNQTTNSKAVPTYNVSKIAWLYFIAILCQMVANTMINAYVSFYVTERMLVSAVVMAGVLTVSRILDLVVGTAAGVIVQKVQPRFGQYRSWLLYGPLLVSGGSTLCFINPNISLAIKMVFVCVGYLAYGVGMSFVQLGQNALIPRIAGSNAADRNKLSSRITQGQNIARLISGALIIPCITFFDGLGVDGYTVVQILFSVIALIGQGFLFFGLREVDKFNPDFKANNEASMQNPFKIIIGAFKNKLLAVLLVSDVLRFTTMQTIGALGAYYFTYVAGNFSMLAVSTTAQGFCSALGAFVCPMFSRRLGKRNSAIVSGTIMTLAMGYLSFFGGSAMTYIVCNSITQFAFVILACNGPNLYIDAGEVQYHKTGIDNRTFVTSVFGIASKFSWLFVGFLTAFVIDYSGYDQVAKTVADVDMMCKLVGGVPAIMFLAFTLLMTVGYRLNSAQVQEAYEANAAKDKAKKLEEERKQLAEQKEEN